MIHGLTDEELNSRKGDGKRIRDTLTPEQVEIVKKPIFGPGTSFGKPFAAVEWHVEQDDKLERAGIDIGVVEAIAAPIRYNVEIGDTALKPDRASDPHARYFELIVEGQANHSGTTPMGSDTRADGLVATAECLLPLIYDLLHRDETTVALGDIEIEGEAINKIPGFTKTLLRLSDPSNHAVEVGLAMLEAAVAQQNERHLRDKDSLFAKQALSLKEISLRPEEAVFFKPEEMLPRHMAALLLADIVNEVTTKHRSENIVGTVGTYTTKFDGKLELGLDIRGIDRYSRDEAIVEIMDRIQALELAPGVWFGEPLAGSGNPVTLDKRLVGQARVAIDDFNCGSSVVMFSAAGHDAQNAARAGIPTVMLFSQSNNGGLAHHPDAYTNPDNIEKGLWALAALSMRLAA